MPHSPSMVWFRNDLRTIDNHALHHACADTDGGVIAIAAITLLQWERQDESRSRVGFWLANLADLQQQLEALNIPLLLVWEDDNKRLPAAIGKLAKKHGVSALYFNKEYPEWEQKRDSAVAAHLKEIGIACRDYDSDVVLPPGSVINKQGLPYKVFTPFSKAWRYQYTLTSPQPLPAPPAQKPIDVASSKVPKDIGYTISLGAAWRPDLWPAGAQAASDRLQCFVNERVADYGNARDFPAQSGTSSLSPYLTVGAIGVRQCIAALRSASDNDDWLSNQWLTELIWREFYRHLLVAFPEMNRWEPFRPEVQERIVWQIDQDLFDAWCQGETGFPIVDAGMKQLLETGWMHNRVRMITASFFSKLLRQHWRAGATFFMRHLIDGDFASNLGGWQWSSSVGADAAPYFRIFNPMRQAERFDPNGDYVAQWLPEVAELEGMQRHDSLFTAGCGRPAPIIDYALARQQSLDDYNEGA